jgi:ArsR family metal-binding transcriptional regulator
MMLLIHLKKKKPLKNCEKCGKNLCVCPFAILDLVAYLKTKQICVIQKPLKYVTYLQTYEKFDVIFSLANKT